MIRGGWHGFCSRSFWSLIEIFNAKRAVEFAVNLSKEIGFRELCGESVRFN